MIAWLLVITVTAGYLRRVNVFSALSDGAMEGMKTAATVLPCLASTLMALSVLSSSGLLDQLCRVLSPAMRLFGLPEGVMPLFLMRPLSGSASLATLSQIMSQYGPDSRTGLVACAMMGSGETVLYTCSLYLAAAGVKKSRYIIPASLAGWVAGCITAGLFFR